MSEPLVDALTPLLAGIGLELFDVEVRAREVLVFVDRAGGVDLDDLARANRLVSGVLDELDPIEGRYTLEVSSPGLERRLRTPAHFAGAVGQAVTVRTTPGGPVRRVSGRLVSSDDGGFVVEGPEVPDGSLRLPYDQVERARTVFEWGSPAGAPRAKDKKKTGAQGRTTGSVPTTADPGATDPDSETETERVITR
jgi:ribosome maturation factor RimP